MPHPRPLGPAAALLGLALAPAWAATIEVNNLGDVADPLPEDGVCNVAPLDPVPQCTLRAAIQTANALAGPDTIVLAPGGIYQLSLSGNGGAEVGDLDINDAVDIIGFTGAPPADSADLPRIDALGLGDRIFDAALGVAVTLRGLHLRGGNAEPASGGALRSSGPFVIEHVIADYNRGSYGGAIYIGGGDGLRLIRDSHFENNRSPNEAGALYSSNSGHLRIERSSFRDNRGHDVDGSTLSLPPALPVVIEDSSFDGTELGPPVAGLGNPTAILARGPQDLVLRNVTIAGYTAHALSLEVQHPDEPGTPRLRIANSILSAGGSACEWQGVGGETVDFLIAYSMVESNTNCSQFYSDVRQNSPQLAPSVQDPGRVTWSRAPLGVFSNLTDNGIPPDRSPPANAPELACTATDQRGSPRPVDGNGDDVARCDFGAVEAAEPPTFIVDTAGDAVDDVPGDGLCETLSMECSLRAAVMEANALPDVQRIRFTPGLDPIELIAPPHPAAAGGDLDIGDALIISGERIDGQPGTKIVQGVAGERLFDVPPGFVGPLVLRNLQLSGGDSGATFGGALRVMEGTALVEWSRLSENHSTGAGGAIAVQGGLVMVLDSDLHGNSTEGRGSALFVGSTAGALIMRSSVRDNLSFDGPLPLAAVEAEAGATLYVADSTLAGNSAGLRVESPAVFQLLHSTVANNAGAGVEGLLALGNVLVMQTSIVSDNGGGDCALTNPGDANIMSGYLLSSDGSCTLPGATVSFIADPLLGPLSAVPGHPTRAIWPQYDAEGVSPALDVAPAVACDRPDQIGQNRPVDLPDYDNVNGPCDLGAVERQTDELFRNSFETAAGKSSASTGHFLPPAFAEGFHRLGR